VEYCNYPSGSTLSDERAGNGSPEPFNVRYWGVGNENWGCGGRMAPEHYADEFRQFSGYLRNWGGTKLFLIACGPNGNDGNWSRKFLTQNMGARVPDGFAMHFYENSQLTPTQFTADAMNMQMSTFQRVEQAIVQQRAMLDGFEPKPVRAMNLMLDEWGVWDRMIPDEEKNYGKLWQQITMRGAVAAGLGLNMFNRQADKLYMCNIAQIVNVLHSMLLTDGPTGRNCVRTTTYYAFMMFKAHRLKTAVRTEKDSNDALDLSISASRSGNRIVVTLVNPRTSTDVHADCSFTGATPTSSIAYILHHADMNAYNSFDDPDKITTKPWAAIVENGRMRVEVPAMSIVTVTLIA
jgi:alpha-N-arabinofuranosidase